MDLSIVTTLYKSETFVDSFVDQALAAGESYGGKFEVILVDDGSPDRSLEMAVARANCDQRITVVQLSRNFGHHAAILCGLEHSSGERVFLIDSDLEVSPAIVHDFCARMDQTGADVVFGVQSKRQGAFASRSLGSAFWYLFNAISDTKVPNDLMTERLMVRSYVRSLLMLGDRNIFLGGMFHWAGFRQIPIHVTKSPREIPSTYSFFKRLALLVRAVSSFSSAPLQIIFWVGAIIFCLTMVYSAFLVLQKVLYPEYILGGFTVLAVLQVISFGMNFMAIGMVGLYLHRVFRQVQDRPRYLVSRIYQGGGRVFGAETERDSK